MLRNRLLPAFVALGLAACGQPDTALRVNITVDGATTTFATDCLRVSVLDADGDALADGSATFVEPLNGEAVVVVRKQSTWPSSVTVRVEGLVGPPLASGLTNEERPAAEEARCAASATLRLNARAEKTAQSFPTQGLGTVDVTLARSASDTDADNDGYASVVAGETTRADCNDNALNTHYGLAQLCTTVEDTDCNDLPGCDDPTCFNLGVCAAPPTRLVLVGGGANNIPLAMPQPSRTVVPLSYQLQNAAGVRAAIRDTPVSVTLDNADVELVNTADGGGYVIPVGASQLTVSLRTRVSLLDTVNVALSAQPNVAPDAGLATAMLAVTFKPTDVARLVFVDAGTIALEAGQCSPQQLELQLQDANNQPTMAPTGGLVVSFNTPGTINDGAIFDNASCTAPLATRNLSAGDRSVSMHVGYDTYGSYVATASAPGASPAQYAFTVNAGPATRLAFFSMGGAPVGSLPLDTGVCSADGALFIGLRDAQGNPTSSSMPLTLNVALTGGNNDLRFYTAPCDGSAGTTTFTLPANTPSMPLYVTGAMSTAGDITATMSTTTSGITAAALSISVGAGPASVVELSGTQETVTAGSCSSAGFTVRLKDMNGNSVRSDGGVRVTLVDLASDLTFFVDGGCFDGGVNYVDIASGASEQLFAFRGTVARTFDLGPPQSSAPALPTYTGVVTGNVVQPGAAASVLLGPDAGTIEAGIGCAPYSVQVRDAFFNVTPYGTGGPGGGVVQRNLVVSNPSLKVSSDAVCSTGGGAVLPSGAGTASLYLSTNQAGVYPFTVDPTSLGLTSNPALLTVTPGAASLVIRDAGMPWVVTAGDCRAAVISNEDTFGNPVSLTASVSVDGGDGTQLFTAADCSSGLVTNAAINFNGPTAALGIRPTRTGGKVVTAGATGSLALEVRPGASVNYTFEGAFPNTLTAGHCAGPVTLTRYDAFNNLTDGGQEEPNLTSTGTSAVAFSQNPACSTAATTALFIPGATGSSEFYLRATAAGDGGVRAALGGALGARGLLVVADAGARLALTSSTVPSLTPTVCTAVYVEQQDGFGNRVAGSVTADLSTDGGFRSNGSTAIFFSDPGCTNTTTQVGVSPLGAFYIQPQRVATPMLVTASATGLAAGTRSWNVTAGPANALVWAPAPVGSVPRFGCELAGTVQTQDGFGNPADAPASVTWVPSAALGATLYVDSACTTVATGGTAMVSANIAGPLYMNVTGGTGTLQAEGTVNGNFRTTPSVAITVTGGNGSLVLTPDAGYLEAGACVERVVARLDGNGVAVTRGTTSFSVTVPAGATLHSDASCSGSGLLTLPGSIVPGTSQTTVYVRGRSVETVSALPLAVTDTNAGSTAGSGGIDALPLVRRGSCNLDDGGSAANCVLTPPIPNNDLSRSFLMFTSTGGNNHAAQTNLGCRLAGSPAAVVCQTNAATVTPLFVNYQVVSWGRDFADGGVTVQHVPTAVNNNTSVTLANAVNPAQSFVLLSGYGPGDANGSDDFFTGYLESGTSVRLETIGGGDKFHDLQVVSWAGSVVQTGEAVLDGGTFALAVPVAGGIDAGHAFLLYASRGEEGNVEQICKRQVRGWVNGNSLQFSRGDGGTPECANDALFVRWQLVTLPGNNTVSHAANITINGTGQSEDNLKTADWTIASTPHKSVAITGGQGPGGQSTGESRYLEAGQDRTGPFHAMLELIATKVTLTCQNPKDRASAFAPMLLQFDP